MPRIDIRCDHDHLSEVMRPLADYPHTPPCPAVLADGSVCGAATTQIHLPPRVTWTLDPVVVYRAGDGTFRFPGDAHGTQAARYDQLGYDRIELRSAQDVRRFESQMNQRELSRAQRRVEIHHAQRAIRERQSRGELYQHMQHFSRVGRDVARAAIARNNAKAAPRAADPGFHVEVFSYDRSNRDVSRDAQGRRRRD